MLTIPFVVRQLDTQDLAPMVSRTLPHARFHLIQQTKGVVVRDQRGPQVAAVERQRTGFDATPTAAIRIQQAITRKETAQWCMQQHAMKTHTARKGFAIAMSPVCHQTRTFSSRPRTQTQTPHSHTPCQVSTFHSTDSINFLTFSPSTRQT
jgi:hypothetical protein